MNACLHLYLQIGDRADQEYEREGAWLVCHPSWQSVPKVRKVDMYVTRRKRIGKIAVTYGTSEYYGPDPLAQ